MKKTKPKVQVGTLPCTTCSNAIHDDHWGEYKCKLDQHRTYDSKGELQCGKYKHGEPTLTARKEDDYDQL